MHSVLFQVFETLINNNHHNRKFGSEDHILKLNLELDEQWKDIYSTQPSSYKLLLLFFIFPYLIKFKNMLSISLLFLCEGTNMLTSLTRLHPRGQSKQLNLPILKKKEKATFLRLSVI